MIRIPEKQDDRLQDEVLGQQLLDGDPGTWDDSVVEGPGPGPVPGAVRLI